MLKEVLEFLNPGRGIIETKRSPHARTLRTDFKGKLQDAFFVLFGNRKEGLSLILGCGKSTAPAHAGVVDGMLLFLPAALDRLMMIALKSNNPFIFAAGIVLAIIDVPLILARILIAAILAYNPLSLFVIGVVHLVSEYREDGAELKASFVKGLLAVIQQKFPGLSDDCERIKNTPYSARYGDERTLEEIGKLKEDLESDPQAVMNRLAIQLVPHGKDNEMEIRICKRVFLGLAGEDDPELLFSYRAPISQPNQTIRGFEEALVELNCGDGLSKLEALMEESQDPIPVATEFLKPD